MFCGRIFIKFLKIFQHKEMKKFFENGTMETFDKNITLIHDKL